MDSEIKSLDLELTQKVGELETQRYEREQLLVELTLNRIAEEVTSHESDILKLMADGKGQCQHAVREVVVREVKRAADGQLWCPEYVERAKSEQQMNVYTGSHWQIVGSQLYKDFIGRCAMKCGVPESLRMNPVFMRALFESVAFNLAASRSQKIPKSEVWLNMHNGTLVISSDGTVTLRKHRKEDLFRYTLPYSYDPQAECPQWDNFIDRVLPAPDAQQLLREFIGYIFMSDHRLEKMLLLYGEGLNGKSVTLEVVESLLGSSNVSYLSLSDLSNDDVKRACIEDKKLNVSHESGKDVNPNVLKQMTSGEPVLIRNLYRDPRMINNYGKLIAAFNILPRAENTLGFFRRLLILHYQVTIPREEIDRQLAAKLKGELSGILNWVLKTLPALMTRNGFSPSESCERALEQYRLQSDNVKLFLNEMCEPSEYSMLAKDIFDAYRSYCLSSSLKPLGKTRFYDRLESLGYPCEKYGNLRRFKLKVIEQ